MLGVTLPFPGGFSMRSESWFGRLWTRLSSGVVQEVPAALEECESCREVDCTQERWLHCERRLEAEAATLSANASGRTNELLPRVVPPWSPAAEPTPAPGPTAEEGSGQLRARKISGD